MAQKGDVSPLGKLADVGLKFMDGRYSSQYVFVSLYSTNSNPTARSGQCENQPPQ